MLTRREKVQLERPVTGLDITAKVLYWVGTCTATEEGLVCGWNWLRRALKGGEFAAVGGSIQAECEEIAENDPQQG